MAVVRDGLVAQALARVAGRRRVIVLLAATALVAAQLESAAFVVIAMAAQSLGTGDSAEVLLRAGPVSADLSVAAALGLGVGCIAAAGLAFLVFMRVQARTAAAIDRAARDRVLAGFSTADWDYQAGQRHGSLQARLRLAQNAVKEFNALTNWLRAAAMVTVFVLVALLVDPLAAAAIGGLAVVLAAVILPIRRITRRLSHQVSTDEYAYGEALTETELHAAELRVFRAWPMVDGELGALSRRVEAGRRRLIALAAVAPLLYQYGGMLIIIGLLWLTLVVDDPRAGLGGVAAVGLLLLRSVQYGQLLQVCLQTLAETVPALRLLEQDLAAPPPQRRVGSRVVPAVRRVELARVSYRYPGAAADALHGVSLRLDVGTVVGVAGESGSGKSTLAQILLRLREPTAGAVLVDDVDLGTVREDSWFARCGYVPQQPRLLAATLRANVAFYADGYDDGQVRAAVLDAGLGDLVDELPAGLDTPIGPGSRQLSGGQVQRIGIARALLRRPDVIVMDEPTSALDPASEGLVHDSLDRLGAAGDLLIVVIAHRPSTLARCDRVVTLSEGRVVGDRPVLHAAGGAVVGAPA